MKFTREGPRKFVECNYDEKLLENIKKACTQHFKEKRNCDVLASGQGPSYTRLYQLPSLNVVFIRFTTPASIKNNGSASESWTLPPSMKKPKTLELFFYSQKFMLLIWWMKLGKLMWNKERSSVKILIEKFNMKNNEWSISKEVIFEVMAYKAKSDDESFWGNTWVAKRYNASSKETFEKMRETCEPRPWKWIVWPDFSQFPLVKQSWRYVKILASVSTAIPYISRK